MMMNFSSAIVKVGLDVLRDARFKIIPFAGLLFIARCSLLVAHYSLLVARSPCGARKNTTQLAKYPHVLYAKPSKKMYLLHLPGILEGQTVAEFAKLSI